MHDKNGKPLKKGDKVMIEGVVEETYATPDFCNIRIGFAKDKPNAADNVHGSVTLNSRQVELIEN